MSSMKWICALTAVLAISTAFSQTQPSFDLDTYKQFLSSHKTMTSDELRAFRPAGTFARTSRTDFDAALYADTIQMKYQLTPGERSLIAANGFMVSERYRYTSFATAFNSIYHSDLPVFVSTDAILHAVHMSYDAMLRDTEQRLLIAKLDTLLKKLHGQLPALSARYESTPAMRQSFIDLDLYLTIPRKLLNPSVTPVFPESQSEVNAVMDLISHEKAADYPLFSSTSRTMDFSQFTVRGHYTQSPELGNYFKAMMWLGRTEMYLLAPVSADPPPTEADIQRQTIDALLVEEAADASNAWPLLEEIDSIIRFFVGESDNVTLPNVRTLMDALDVEEAGALLDTAKLKAFQDTLALKSFAFQRILSQIISSDPGDPDQLRPASSFLLLGQRFVIDSYVTGSVVFDKIMFENKKVWRPLPSSLDVLFAIGNNAAAQLLEPELSKYHYAPNLAAVRYLVDAYDKEFWTGTLYNNWLNTIRTLNPPEDRSALPRFMQTAAWWQEKMTTQLASWAELRHDNLLYAKPSYTGSVVCSFPESYVEPVPEFFATLKEFASIAEQKFAQFNIPFWGDEMSRYWGNMKNLAETLGGIAEKELSKTPLTESEKSFLRGMLYESSGCGGPGYSGWYAGMFYTRAGVSAPDLVVADIHTCPSDESGTRVGWVMHIGTGPVNFGVFTAELPDGRFCAFLGPVMSYYERVTSNFDRLTDERWRTEYMTPTSARPSFVNLYCADASGNAREAGPMLLTGVIDRREDMAMPTTLELGQNFPNPFNGMTVISFSIPQLLAGGEVDLTIYDVQGRKVKQLIHQPMGEGSYSVRWDGTNDRGSSTSSGVYFYHLSAGPQRLSGRMSFVK